MLVQKRRRLNANPVWPEVGRPCQSRAADMLVGPTPRGCNLHWPNQTPNKLQACAGEMILISKILPACAGNMVSVPKNLQACAGKMVSVSKFVAGMYRQYDFSFQVCSRYVCLCRLHEHAYPVLVMVVPTWSGTLGTVWSP